MKAQFFILLTLLCPLEQWAQTTFIQNGPEHNKVEYTAYTHATVYVNATTVLKNTTVVVSKGQIISVNEGGLVPAGAVEVNLSGRTIYPSFIDLYSSYGMQALAPNKRPAAGEQFNSTKEGAYAWNEALKPEMSAASIFKQEETRAAAYRAMGIANTLTGNQDGIIRGTTALVHTGAENEHQCIIQQNITASLSFNKGTSKQPYPSSLMGSIALIRQTYYDAQWYTKQNKETNLSLQAFTQQLALPAIFDASNKFDVLRAGEIAKEFKAKYLIKTGGDDYQRLQEIKSNGFPLIVPVNYPKPYKITDAEEAKLISTADLKHWELAPANLYFLWKNGITFCITSFGCDKPNLFLKNIRLAIQHGLPKEEALKALTTTPAQLINQKNIGEIKANMMANFLICNGDLFEDKTQIIQHVVNGKLYDINPIEDYKFADEYNNQNKQLLNTKKGIVINEIDTAKLKLNIQNGVISLQFLKPSLNTHFTSSFKYNTSTYPYTITEMSFINSGESIVWRAVEPNSETKKETGTKKQTLLSDTLIWFPFNDYGRSSIKTQQSFLFKNATVWTNEKEGILTQADVQVINGKITAVGKNLVCGNCVVIDATGKHLTNGIIDEHSHIAISHGVNEGTQAVTSEVRIGDAVNPDDINIYRQLAGGVIGAQLLHGSANPIGGQSALIKLRWGLGAEKMKMESANGYIKFALGENVKQSNWGEASVYRYPQTRMGVEQVFVDAFTRAKQYELKLKTDINIRRDLELDALVEILNNKRFITCHSYVQSEINMLMHVADSFGFKVNTFTHILEGYKVADKMKKHGVNASTFADWWAYKYEVIDAIPQNAAMLHRMGVTVAVNSDDAEMGRRLNHEAAKIIKYGKISEEDAWKMVTLNPARMLRIDNRTGSIKVGKDADLVLWSDYPLSVYAKPVCTLVDGIKFFDLEEDLWLRHQTNETRQRIIKKMMQEEQAGVETQKHISTQEPNYHCND